MKFWIVFSHSVKCAVGILIGILWNLYGSFKFWLCLIFISWIHVCVCFGSTYTKILNSCFFLQPHCLIIGFKWTIFHQNYYFNHPLSYSKIGFQMSKCYYGDFPSLKAFTVEKQITQDKQWNTQFDALKYSLEILHSRRILLCIMNKENDIMAFKIISKSQFLLRFGSEMLFQKCMLWTHVSQYHSDQRQNFSILRAVNLLLVGAFWRKWITTGIVLKIIFYPLPLCSVASCPPWGKHIYSTIWPTVWHFTSPQAHEQRSQMPVDWNQEWKSIFPPFKLIIASICQSDRNLTHFTTVPTFRVQPHFRKYSHTRFSIVLDFLMTSQKRCDLRFEFIPMSSNHRKKSPYLFVLWCMCLYPKRVKHLKELYSDTMWIILILTSNTKWFLWWFTKVSQSFAITVPPLFLEYSHNAFHLQESRRLWDAYYIIEWIMQVFVVKWIIFQNSTEISFRSFNV